MKLIKIVTTAIALAAFSQVEANAQCIKIGTPRSEVSRPQSSYSNVPKGLNLRERIRLAPRNFGDSWALNEGGRLIRLPRFNMFLREKKNYCDKIILR
jgi:hypothetical protein